MKNFTLQCDSHHKFDGWFPDRDALLKQIEMKFVECPYCGSNAVQKMLSAPQLNSPKMRRNTQAEMPIPAVEAQPPASAPVKPAGAVPTASALMPPADMPKQMQDNLTAMRMMIKHIQKTVKTEFKYVGDNFANEARKMHEGVVEAENIYGECSEEERQELQEDGIDVFALPELPKDN